MALPATDTFTAADGTTLTAYSASWTNNDGVFSINTNAVYNSTASSPLAAAHWNADSFGNDQYSQVVISAIANGKYCGVIVRCAAAVETYYYFADAADDGPYLGKVVAGTDTGLASGGGTHFAVGNTIRLEAEGTTITPLRNGSAYPGISGQTDSSIASGSAGICGIAGATSVRMDDWEGGVLGAAASLVPSLPLKYIMPSLVR